MSKLVKVLLKSAGIAITVNREIRNSIVGEEAHSGVQVLSQVIDKEQEQAGSQYRALWDSGRDRDTAALLSINDNHLGPVAEE